MSDKKKHTGWFRTSDNMLVRTARGKYPIWVHVKRRKNSNIHDCDIGTLVRVLNEGEAKVKMEKGGKIRRVSTEQVISFRNF